MQYFPITIVLVVVVETLLAAVMSGSNHLTDGQEIEENLIISRRRAMGEHDHRTDSAYAGILSSEDEIEAMKRLKPYEVKQRMKIILESMDQNKNGYIEKIELSTRLMEAYRKLSTEESDTEFQNSDLDGDGLISWNEYIADTYLSNEDFEEDVTNAEKLLFVAADVDKDSLLSKIEFRYFYTPEEYPQMKPILMRGLMDRFDKDKNGIITFEEFVGDRKDEHTQEWFIEERNKFNEELDINKNGILEEDEIFEWAAPSNQMVVESEAENLIFKSDKNKDGILSYDEVLDNYMTFISPDSEGYYIFRDEL